MFFSAWTRGAGFSLGAFAKGGESPQKHLLILGDSFTPYDAYEGRNKLTQKARPVRNQTRFQLFTNVAFHSEIYLN